MWARMGSEYGTGHPKQRDAYHWDEAIKESMSVKRHHRRAVECMPLHKHVNSLCAPVPRHPQHPVPPKPKPIAPNNHAPCMVVSSSMTGYVEVARRWG
jgi:hypothetical protein